MTEKQLTGRAHARLLYIQALKQLKRYNEAEADMQTIYDEAIKDGLDPASAMIRADEYAVHTGLVAKRNNSRDAAQMLGTMYLVTVDWSWRYGGELPGGQAA
jgi:hypothetical protein